MQNNSLKDQAIRSALEAKPPLQTALSTNISQPHPASRQVTPEPQWRENTCKMTQQIMLQAHVMGKNPGVEGARFLKARLNAIKPPQKQSAKPQSPEQESPHPVKHPQHKKDSSGRLLKAAIANSYFLNK